MPRFSRLVALTTVLLAATTAPAWAAPTITEHRAGLPATAGPLAITPGSAGDLWFIDDTHPGALGQISTGGATTEYATGLTHDAAFGDITPGPGGSWFTETSKNKIGRVSAAGAISELSGSSHDKPVGIVEGPDNNLWYTATGKGGAIVRMTPGGSTKEFTAGLTTNAAPQDIAAGPDGNLWFTEAVGGRLGRITPQGVITEFLTGAGTGTLQDITAGPDGNLWFTVNGPAPAIGRSTPNGTITLFTAGLPLLSAPQGIVAGADGNLHFTDPGANVIGQVTPAGVITTTGAGLTVAAGLGGIAAGADGTLWFAEHEAHAVGQITVAPAAVDVLPWDVTSTAGTLTGTATPNGQTATAYVEWGTTTAYGTASTPVSIGSGAASQSFDATMTGLAASTTYHARVVATNATGTSYGPDRTFSTTAPGAPSATTRPATGVSEAGATLNATVNPESAATTYRFEWGTSKNYGDTAPAAPGSLPVDAADHAVSVTLTGLEPNTTYHFRVVATGSGTTAGADRSFRTAPAAPAATTLDATGLGTDHAVLHGVVDPRNSVTAYHFEWGTTTDYGHVAPDDDAVAGDDHAPHGVAAPVSGLAPDTTYHFRVVATTNDATVAGDDVTFRTTALPADTPRAADPPAGDDPLSPPATAPAASYGAAVATTVTQGTVRVRRPDGSLVVLGGSQAIPTGSTIDATHGELLLTSALDAAGTHTQTARFHGAVFRVRQPRAEHGMVHLDLRSPATGCATPTGTAGRAVAAAKRRKPRSGASLWGKDDHGRYMTGGRGATATVRGTVWTMTETCAGTVTKVVQGAVRVFDKGKRRAVTVKAGHSYLARVARG